MDPEVTAKARKSEDIGTCEGGEGEEDLSQRVGNRTASATRWALGVAQGGIAISARDRTGSRPRYRRSKVEKGRPSSPARSAIQRATISGICCLGLHKGNKPSQDQEKSPETRELGDFTAGGGDFGYYVRALPSSHKSCHKEKAMHVTQREAPEAPEIQELNNMTLEGGDFGYNW